MPGSNRVYHTPAEWAKNRTQFRVLVGDDEQHSFDVAGDDVVFVGSMIAL
jgi:hypothetical protein